jgi:hypothetical protein
MSSFSASSWLRDLTVFWASSDDGAFEGLILSRRCSLLGAMLLEVILDVWIPITREREEKQRGLAG